ncbi:MAG: lmo0937 family membrane protein [Chloroflexi bacterium]|nr:MAG: lmo0937 family membrane protein [Chloroflexota bacterium]TMD81825.1 MAG: lmo0937 family membrane protein [Chloroflexota bacterium]
MRYDIVTISCLEGPRPPKEVNNLTSLIWTIVVVLVVLWLLGWSFHVAGGLIFLLLVLAIAGVIYNLVAGGMYGGAHHHHTSEVTEVEHHDV